MFIHFAFARLKGNLNEQLDSLINMILNKKKLKFRENPEFIPVFKPHIHPRFRNQEVRYISLESFKSTKNGVVANMDYLKFINPEYDIHFLSEKIRMICFIKIAFRQLENSYHSKVYGKLGLVFGDKFLKKNAIKPVQYYQEESLYDDSLIIEWNLKYAYKPSLSPNEIKNREDLKTKILAYRKPSTLFKSFVDSRMLAIERTDSGTKHRIMDAYERYDFGYDFQAEREWRLVSYNEDYIEFAENDLYMLIVPNLQSKLNLQKYFKSKWKVIPKICEFP